MQIMALAAGWPLEWVCWRCLGHCWCLLQTSRLIIGHQVETWRRGDKALRHLRRRWRPMGTLECSGVSAGVHLFAVTGIVFVSSNYRGIWLARKEGKPACSLIYPLRRPIKRSLQVPGIVRVEGMRESAGS